MVAEPKEVAIEKFVEPQTRKEDSGGVAIEKFVEPQTRKEDSGGTA